MQSKKDGKDQESIQSSTTPGPGYQWESNKLTVRHHKREPRGQDNLQIYFNFFWGPTFFPGGRGGGGGGGGGGGSKC